MKFYRYCPDGAYSSVGFQREDQFLLRMMYWETDSRKDNWTPRRLRLVRSERQFGDFPCLTSSSKVPIFSLRAWRILEPLIGHCCEPLEVILPSDEKFFLINMMEKIDCVDLERSQHNAPDDDGAITWIHKFALREEMLVGKHLFNNGVWDSNDLLVDDVFRHAVESNGLEGLLFEDLPLVGDDEPSKAEKETPVRDSALSSPSIKEQSIDEQTLYDIGQSVEITAEALGLHWESASPNALVEAVDTFVYEWQKGNRPPVDPQIDLPLMLGSLWGQQLVRAFGWEWTGVTFPDETKKMAQGIGVVPPDRSMLILPFNFIYQCMDHGMPVTILLSFNMLADGSRIPAFPEGAFYNIMQDIQYIIPRD